MTVAIRVRTTGLTGSVVAFLIAASLIIPASTFATDIGWTNSTGGSFGVGANWDGGAVPGATDRAMFTNGQATAYTITNDQVRSIDSLEVNGDKILLDLAGNNLTLTNTTSGATGLYGLAVGLDKNATLTLGGGATLDVETFIVSQSEASGHKNATLYVQGAGTVLNAPSDAYGHSVVGWYGHGTLHIRDGGRVNLEEFTTGNESPTHGSHGTVIVEGENSLLYGTDTWNMGRRAGSTLIVTNGATVNWRYHIRMGQRTYLCKIEVDDSDMEVLWSFECGRYAGSTSSVDVRNGGQLKLFTLSAASYTDGLTTSIRVRGEDSGGTASRLYTVGRSAHGGGSATFGRTLESDGAVASLTVEDGAEVDIDANLNLRWTSTMTIDGGTVTNAQLNAGEGATYALTLHPDEAAVPLQSVERTAPNGTYYPGDATITDMTFTPSLAPGFDAGMGDTFTVLRYEGDLTGTFKDRPDEQQIRLGRLDFRLDYGDGNDDAITLTCLTAKGTVVTVR